MPSHIEALKTHVRKEAVREESEKLIKIEERLRNIEGFETFGCLYFMELCRAPQIEVPIDFKLPELEKYNRESDPKIHLLH